MENDKNNDLNQGWSNEKWEDTLKKLYKRAAIDDAFRKRCLSNGDAAIKEISGMDLPVDGKVRFVEKLEERVLVLPPAADTGRELQEEELEAVAGGRASCDYVKGTDTTIYETVTIPHPNQNKIQRR